MWEFFKKGMNINDLRLIPHIILAHDIRPVSEQVKERYAHGYKNGLKIWKK